MKRHLFSLLALASVALFPAQPASAGTKEQLIQLQTTVQVLQDNMAQMKQSFDERMGVMKDLITQQTDNVNRMGTTIDNLQKTLQQQNTDSAGKVDQVSGQVKALHDAVDELKANLSKVNKKLDDIQAAQANIMNPTTTQPQGPGVPNTTQNQ